MILLTRLLPTPSTILRSRVHISATGRPHTPRKGTRVNEVQDQSFSWYSSSKRRVLTQYRAHTARNNLVLRLFHIKVRRLFCVDVDGEESFGERCYVRMYILNPIKPDPDAADIRAIILHQQQNRLTSTFFSQTRQNSLVHNQRHHDRSVRSASSAILCFKGPLPFFHG